MNMYKKGLLILLVFIYLSCCIWLFSKYLNIMLYTDLIQTMPAQGFTPQAISKLHYYKSATVHRAAVCNGSDIYCGFVDNVSNHSQNFPPVSPGIALIYEWQV